MQINQKRIFPFAKDVLRELTLRQSKLNDTMVKVVSWDRDLVRDSWDSLNLRLWLKNQVELHYMLLEMGT